MVREHKQGHKRRYTTDEHYIDLQAQAYADRSFLGGIPLSTRTALYFFVGVLALAAAATTFLYLDGRVSKSLDRWRDIRHLSTVMDGLVIAIEDVRIQDRRVREDSSLANLQAHRHALDRVAVSLEKIQDMDSMASVQDAVFIIREAFAGYVGDLANALESREKLNEPSAAGLHARRLDAAHNVRDIFSKNGLQAHVAEFNALDAMATGSQNPGNDLTSVPQAYAHLNELVGKSGIDDSVKDTVWALLQNHQVVLMDVLTLKEQVQSLSQASEEILNHTDPAIRAIIDFSRQQLQAAPRMFDGEYAFVRRMVALAGAVAILVVMASGIMLVYNITTPLRRLAAATENLAQGDRFATVPLRGNADAVGRMARTLDSWLDHLAELDHMRTELDNMRMRLAPDVAGRIPGQGQQNNANDDHEAHDDDRVVRQHGIGEDINTVPSQKPPESAMDSETGSEPGEGILDLSEKDVLLPTTLPPGPRETIEQSSAASAGTSRSGGAITLPFSDETEDFVLSDSIGAASTQLTRMSKYVTAAAVDVERTESLIRSLSETARQLTELEICVAAIRNETNLAVFQPGEHPDDGVTDGTPVYVSADQAGGQKTDGLDMERLEGIRDKLARAERLVRSVRKSLDAVTGVSREIASIASSEALEATSRLLSQSEYLQSMLDDLLKRIAKADQNGPPSLRKSENSDI